SGSAPLVSRPGNSYHEFRGERAPMNLTLVACLSQKFDTNFWGRTLAFRRESLAPAEAGLEIDLLVESSGRVGPGAGAAGDREVAGAGVALDRLLHDVDAKARRVGHRQVTIDCLRHRRDHLVP